MLRIVHAEDSRSTIRYKHVPPPVVGNKLYCGAGHRAPPLIFSKNVLIAKNCTRPIAVMQALILYSNKINLS